MASSTSNQIPSDYDSYNFTPVVRAFYKFAHTVYVAPFCQGHKTWALSNYYLFSLGSEAQKEIYEWALDADEVVPFLSGQDLWLRLRAKYPVNDSAVSVEAVAALLNHDEYDCWSGTNQMMCQSCAQSLARADKKFPDLMQKLSEVAAAEWDEFLQR